MTDRIDFRTPHERAMDEDREARAARFRELMEYAPSATRAINQMAKEWGITREAMRLSLIKIGVFRKGTRAGYKNGCAVVK